MNVVVNAHAVLVAPLVSSQLRSRVYDPATKQFVLLLRVSDIVVVVPLVFFEKDVLAVLFNLAVMVDSLIPSLSVAVAEYAIASQCLYTPVGLVTQAPPSQVLVLVDLGLQYRYIFDGLLQSG